MKRYAVIGAGMMGRVIVKDLLGHPKNLFQRIV